MILHLPQLLSPLNENCCKVRFHSAQWVMILYCWVKCFIIKSNEENMSISARGPMFPPSVCSLSRKCQKILFSYRKHISDWLSSDSGIRSVICQHLHNSSYEKAGRPQCTGNQCSPEGQSHPQEIRILRFYSHLSSFHQPFDVVRRKDGWWISDFPRGK